MRAELLQIAPARTLPAIHRARAQPESGNRAQNKTSVPSSSSLSPSVSAPNPSSASRRRLPSGPPCPCHRRGRLRDTIAPSTPTSRTLSRWTRRGPAAPANGAAAGTGRSRGHRRPGEAGAARKGRGRTRRDAIAAGSTSPRIGSPASRRAPEAAAGEGFPDLSCFVCADVSRPNHPHRTRSGRDLPPPAHLRGCRRRSVCLAEWHARGIQPGQQAPGRV